MLGNYCVSDIETYKEVFMIGIYFPETKRWVEFHISKYRNDLYKFVKFWLEEPIDNVVMFNGLAFDMQVIEWIIDNYQEWHDLSGLEIANKIHVYASDVIDDSNNRIRGTYEESDFSIPLIDLFKIWHFDRDKKSTGLKKLEFSMDFPNIEELPIPPGQEGLTEDNVADISTYMGNDIMATYSHLLYTLGQVEHSLYKGDNKLELRMTLKEEFHFDSINYSDSKIGDEIIRKEYCKAAGVYESDLPRKGVFRKAIPISKCIPPYISFNSPQLTGFLDRIREMELSMDDDFAEVVVFKNQIYDFKKGGLHNRIKGKYFQSTEDKVLIDLDVTSYYPWIMLNNEYAPAHLNRRAFLKALRVIVEKRTELKPLAKTNKRIKGVVGGLKIAANSVFGKTSDIYSWVYDRLVTMQTTLTGELSLLMLIEQMEEAGIPVIMANTDGIMLYLDRTAIPKMREICASWEGMTGYILEENEFEFMAFSTVNDYIGKKLKGETEEDKIKVKGDMLKDSELHGDKSRRIIRLALWEYFINGKDVEDTIRNHKNIYDYCIGVKSSNNYHYELLDRETGERTTLKKMVRYYISKTGPTILKIKNEDSDATGNDESKCESPARVEGYYQPLVTYFNKFEEKEDYNIDYNYYLMACQAIINKIKGRSKKYKIENPNQINLF